MNKQFSYLLPIAILTVGLLTTTPAQACQPGTQERPSQESRLYTNNDVGFSFLIPENYRTMGLNNGQMMLLLEPAAFDYLRCVLRNKIPSDSGGESISVTTEKINVSDTSIRSLLFELMPFMRREGFDFRDATLQGQSALVFSQENRMYDTTMTHVALRSPDRKTFIFISGEKGSHELNRALQSFKFE